MTYTFENTESELAKEVIKLATPVSRDFKVLVPNSPQVSSGGQQVSSEGQQVSNRDNRFPVEGQQVSSGGQQVSNRDNRFPVEGQHAAQIEHSPNCVIYGDTDSSYLSLDNIFPRSAPKDEVIAFADLLAQKVNDTFPEFMCSVFNSNKDQSRMIETNRELVSDKSYFVVKKNYILHYVDKDGVAADDYKIMGLAIKRSDTPQIIKDFLAEMLDALMDQKPFEEINASIKAFKEQYYTVPFLEIGRPMGIKTLVSYEERYAKTKSMKGFSYHIRAAMFYNSLCGPSDIKIRSGDKIVIVYIKDENYPDMKYIAVPLDAEILPEFVSGMNIDRDVQWSKVVAKLNLYLIPLNLTYQDDV